PGKVLRVQCRRILSHVCPCLIVAMFRRWEWWSRLQRGHSRQRVYTAVFALFPAMNRIPLPVKLH
ncbi:MAG: hypothetical protein PHS60_08855, partial [Zavarzinia sp.]|nr:hypothetical protein [Zavarzinia sp.]